MGPWQKVLSTDPPNVHIEICSKLAQGIRTTKKEAPSHACIPLLIILLNDLPSKEPMFTSIGGP